MKMVSVHLISIYLIIILMVLEIKCLQKRCLRCRSRGELGSCKDTFVFNTTDPDREPGIHMDDCPSGWCAKMLEGVSGTFRLDDYGAPTQRMCLQRPPSDLEERCAYTMWNYRKVYMCFCHGDLCNNAYQTSAFSYALVVPMLVTIYNVFI